MDKQTFEKLRDIIYKESGIVLPPQKLPLLTNRIQKRLRALKIKSETEYLQMIELDVSGEELVNLIDAISTNVTYFYREPDHFELYREILSGWGPKKKSAIKVWCAAASTGEEPYTLAFEASETLDLNRQKIRILSTDICSRVLKIALEGVYSPSSVEKMPPVIRNKYLEKLSIDGQHHWKVKQSAMDLVLFRMFNLVQFPYKLKGPVDIIFCRNVMIYFDTPTRDKIIKEFSRLLAPGGYLFLSHSENLIGIDHDLIKVNPSVFKKEG